MKIELVVFDLAGTTVNDNRDVHRALQRALRNFGISVSLEDANAVMGIPKPIAIETLLKMVDFPLKSQGLIREIHELFVDEMISFYKNHPGVNEKSGVSETFLKLHELGIKIAVDTGFDRKITDPLLQRMGWKEKELLDYSVTSDEVPNGRPAPDLIYRAMKLAGVTDAGKVAKVGDTPSDLLEGTAAKCRAVIGITSGAFSRMQLSKEPHTHLIDEIPEIVPILSLS